MNYSEGVTKRVLEAILAGSQLNYKAQQSQGEWDFDLRHSDGRVAALEVTAAVDQPQVETMAAIRNKKRGGSVVSAVKCKRSWMILPVKGAKIQKIREHADEYLSRLEADGVERFSFPQREYQSVESIIRDLQISGGGVFSSEGRPRILIGMPGGGGAVGAEKAIEAGEVEAWKIDNRKKLGAAGTTERHLVVYMDALNGVPWTALTEFEPPSTRPNLPPEITDLWLVGHLVAPDTFRVWRGGANNPWQTFTLTV